MARLAAQDWILAAVEHMARGGVHEVRVEKIARALKVSKGSFYWHFENRSALLTQMLEYWEQEGTRAIIARTDAVDQSFTQRLKSLVDVVFRSTEVEIAFEIQVRAWASTDLEVQKVVHSVDERRVSYMHELLSSSDTSYARARAEFTYSILLGDMLRRNYGKEEIDRGQLKVLKSVILDLS